MGLQRSSAVDASHQKLVFGWWIVHGQRHLQRRKHSTHQLVLSRPLVILADFVWKWDEAWKCNRCLGGAHVEQIVWVDGRPQRVQSTVQFTRQRALSSCVHRRQPWILKLWINWTLSGRGSNTMWRERKCDSFINCNQSVLYVLSIDRSTFDLYRSATLVQGGSSAHDQTFGEIWQHFRTEIRKLQVGVTKFDSGLLYSATKWQGGDVQLFSAQSETLSRKMSSLVGLLFNLSTFSPIFGADSISQFNNYIIGGGRQHKPAAWGERRWFLVGGKFKLKLL